MPFVRKAIKKHFKAQTINDVVDYAKTANSADLDSCVSRKIKIIADENPSMENDQVVAIAYSYCRKDKQSSIEDIIAGEIGPAIFNITD